MYQGRTGNVKIKMLLSGFAHMNKAPIGSADPIGAVQDTWVCVDNLELC